MPDVDSLLCTDDNTSSSPPFYQPFLSRTCVLLQFSLLHLFWKSIFKDKKVTGKVFSYSLPSVGSRADPGVQAVSLQ